MYGTGVYRTPNYIHKVAAPTVDERLRYTRALRDMGLGLYAEGVATTCIDAFVMRSNGNWEGHEFVLYKTAPYIMEATWALDLFRLMAYQCFPRDIAFFSKPEEEITPEERQRCELMRYRNRCFNAIEDTLGYPIGVTETPPGTQWTHEKGNVFFFLQPFNGAIQIDEDFDFEAISQDGAFPVSRAKDRLNVEAPANSVLILKQKQE
jgi:hypothetical protein